MQLDRFVDLEEEQEEHFPAEIDFDTTENEPRKDFCVSCKDRIEY